MKTIDFLVKEFPALGGFPEGAVEAGFLSSDDTLYFVDANGDCPTEWRREGITAEIDDPWVEVSRAQYEAALAAKNEGWIEWGGGECPMDSDAIVDVKLKGGVQITDGETSAAAYYWDHMNQRGDIIAYRLHKPQETTESDDEADLNECIGQDVAPLWNGEWLPPVGSECEYTKETLPDDVWTQCTIDYVGASFVVYRDCYGVELTGIIGDIKFRPIRSEADKKREECIAKLTDAICGEIPDTGMATAAMFATRAYDAIAAGKVRGVKLED